MSVRRRTPDIQDLQKLATDFATAYGKNNLFHVPTKDAKKYAVCLRAIMQAMVTAWAEGYSVGRGIH